jgi:hypothetical protein
MDRKNSILELLEKQKRLEDKVLNSPDSSNLQEMLFKLNLLNQKYKNVLELDRKNVGARKELYSKLAELERKIPALSISDFKENPNSNPTDAEMLRYAQDFLNLSPSDQDKLFLGRGVFKDAYNIPGTGLVLKRAGGKAGTSEGILKDYLSNKIMEDSFPIGTKEDSIKSIDPYWKRSILERPKLINIPENEPILIQKKLLTSNPLFDYKFKKSPKDLNKEYLEKITENLLPDFLPQDLHMGNIGVDLSTGESKAFDAMNSRFAQEQLYKKFPDFKKLLYSLSDPKVYRSIAPLAAKTGAAVGTGLLSLGSEAVESESLNDDANANRLLDIEEGASKFKKELDKRNIPELPRLQTKDLIDPNVNTPSFIKLRNLLK